MSFLLNKRRVDINSTPPAPRSLAIRPWPSDQELGVVVRRIVTIIEVVTRVTCRLASTNKSTFVLPAGGAAGEGL